MTPTPMPCQSSPSSPSAPGSAERHPRQCRHRASSDSSPTAQEPVSSPGEHPHPPPGPPCAVGPVRADALARPGWGGPTDPTPGPQEGSPPALRDGLAEAITDPWATTGREALQVCGPGRRAAPVEIRFGHDSSPDGKRRPGSRSSCGDPLSARRAPHDDVSHKARPARDVR